MSSLFEHCNRIEPVIGVATLGLLAWFIGTTAIAQARADAAEPSSESQPQPAGDPYSWLEEVTGQKALNWVREQNALSTKELESSPVFETIRTRLLSILDSKERIPYVAKHGEYYYNFWRDEKNPRGLWRRTSLAEFKKPEPAWEIVLDLDKLSTSENENWVWKGYNVLYPT